MDISLPNWVQWIYQRRQQFFQAAVLLPEKGIAEGRRAVTFLGKTNSYGRLQAVWRKVFQASPSQTLLKELAQEAPPIRPGSIEAQKEWRELSYLRNAPIKPEGLSLSTFNALFKERASLSREEIPYFLEVFSRLFPRSQAVSFVPSFQQAVAREKAFTGLIRDNLPKGEQAQRAKLVEMAGALAQSLAAHGEGAPFLFLGGTGQENRLVRKILEGLNKTEVFPADLELLYKKEGAKEVVGHIKTRLGKKREQDLLKIKQKVTDFISSFCTALESRSPFLYNKLLDSLQLDLRELTTGSTEEGERVKRYETFLKRLKEKGGEEVLESCVKAVLDGSKETIHSAVHSLFSLIPLPALPTAFDAFEIGTGGQSILLEFAREEGGTFTLRVYGSGGTSDFHPKIREDVYNRLNVPPLTRGSIEKTAIPLVFTGIAPERLGRDFFLKLLSYRADPEWIEGISHTPQEFYEFLDKQFGGSRAPPSYLSSVPKRNGEWENFQLFFSHQENRNPLEFREALYAVRRQALVDLWYSCAQDPFQLGLDPHFIPSLEAACETLSKDATFLHKEGRIEQGELDKIYATVFEIKSALAKRAHQVHHLGERPSFLFSEEIRGGLQKLLEGWGVTSGSVHLLRDLALSLLGDEMEGSVDALLNELIPPLTGQLQQVKERSLKELFSVATLKEYEKDIRAIRPSLLHLTRLLGWVIAILFKALYRGIAARMLISLLQKMVPSLSHLSYMRTTLFANLLLEYGLPRMLPYLPKEAVEPLAAAYAFYQEMISYVKRRVAFVVIKEVAQFFLKKEQIQEVKALLKRETERLTKEGEVSFDVSSAPPLQGTLTVPPPAPIEQAAPAQVALPHSAPLVLFHSAQERLYADTIKMRLLQINKAAKKLYGAGSKENRKQVYFYLKRELLLLPTPDPRGGLWDVVERPDLCIEAVHGLALQFNEMAKWLDDSGDVGERVILLYAMEAIVDRLARRCDPRIKLAPNGCDLALFMSNSSLKLTDPKWIAKLRQVAAYFGLDLEKTYEVAEINKRRRDCVLNFESIGTWRPSLFTGSRFVIQLSYYGLLLSKEGSYYLELLKDPNIQKKLAFWGAKSRWEQISLLFRDPSFEEWRQIDLTERGAAVVQDTPLSLGTSEGEKRYGILPRSFYLLRSLHLVGVRAVVGSMAARESFGLSKQQGLVMAPAKVDPFSSYKTVDAVARFATTCFHKLTLDFFRKLTLASNLFIEKSLSSDSLLRDNKERLLEIRAQAFKIDSIPAFWSTWLFAEKYRKTTEQILRSYSLHQDLPPHVSQALEMVPLYPKDQLVRALAFFGENKRLLKEARYRLFFDFFFHKFRALPAQLRESREISEALSRFFTEAIEGFDAEEALEPLLFLVKAAEEARKTLPTLPNFRVKLRELLQRKQHHQNFGKILSTLLSTYKGVEPEDLTKGEERLATIDFSRFLFSRRSLPEDICEGLEEELFIWRPHVENSIQEKVVLRTTVIQQLFEDAGEKKPRVGIWDGSFPTYELEGREIQLYSLQGAQRRALELQIKGILNWFGFASELSDGCYLTQSVMSFPKEHLTVKVSGELYEVYKELGGRRLRLIKTPNAVLTPFQGKYQLKAEETLWISEGDTHSLLCLKGEETIWEVPLQIGAEAGSFNIVTNESLINARKLREVDLSKTSHNLHLLTAFEEEGSMKGYVLPERPNHLVRLEFTTLDLVFNGEERGGEHLLFSQTISPGFFIAKRQKKPHLLRHGRTLLLENLQGEQRVLLRREPISALYSSAFIHRMSRKFIKIGLPPALLGLLEQGVREVTEDGNRCDLFTLSSDHRLEAESPEGAAYLLLYHAIYGNEKEWPFYSEQLLSLGRRVPFSAETFSLLEQLSLCFLASHLRKGERLQLTLAALREENRLLFRESSTAFHQNLAIGLRQSPGLEIVKDGGSITGIQPPSLTTQSRELSRNSSGKILMKRCTGQETTQKKQEDFFTQYWTLSLCFNYQNYLKGLEQGEEAFLSEEEELFLLHGIVETGNASFKALREKVEEQSSIESRFVLALFTSFLPTLRKRFLHLQTRLVGMETWKMRTESFSLFFSEEIYKLWFSLEAPSHQINRGYQEGGSQLRNRIQIASDQARKKALPLWQQVSSQLPSLPEGTALGGISAFRMLNYSQGITGLLSTDSLTPTVSMSRVSSLITFLSSVKELGVEKGAQELTDLQGFVKKIDLTKSLAEVPVSFAEICPNDFFLYFPQYYALASVTTGELASRGEIFRATLALYDGHYKGDLKKLLLILKMVALSGTSLSYAGLRKAIETAKIEGVDARQTEANQRPLKEAIQGLLNQQFRLQLLLPVVNWWQRRVVTKSIAAVQQSTQERALELAAHVGGEELVTKAKGGYQKLHLFYHATHYLFSVLRAVKKTKEFTGKKVEKAPRAPSLTFAPEHAASLAKREGLLDQMMNRLLQEFFSVDPQGRLLPKVTGQKLRETLSAMAKESSRYFQAQEERIQSLVNHLHFRPGKSSDELFRLVKRERFSFKEILEQFVRGNFEKLSTHACLQQQEREKIKEEILLYLSVKGRLFHLFRAAEEGTIADIGAALQRRRNYKFDAPSDQVLAHLLFEAGTSQLVKAEQAHALQEVRKTGGSALLELPTGAGKTFWFTPVLQYLQGRDSLPLAIWPAPLFPTSMQRVGKQGEELFSRGYRVFHFQRSERMSKENLWALYLMFTRAKGEGQQIHSTREDQQGFELSFIERVLEGANVEELTLWKQSLEFLRLHGSPLCDEFHDQVEPRKNLLNYPLGKPAFLDMRLVEIATGICKILMESRFSRLITIKSKKPYALDPAVYRTEILPPLANKIALLWKVPAAREKELIDFLKGGEITPYLRKHPLAAEIFFARGLLSQELPKALEKRPQIDYDMEPAHKGGSGYAQPSRGNNALQKKSWFQNPYETLVKTILLRLHIRLTDEEKQSFIAHLRKMALEERKRRSCSLEKTEPAEFFQEVTLCPLFGYTKEQEKPIFDALDRSDEAILRFVQEMDAREIRYFKESLSSDAQNFLSMYPRFTGCTASISNRGCAPGGTTSLLLEGAQEESERLIKEKCTEIVSVPPEDPQELLPLLLNQFFRIPSMRVLIDPAALFNGMKNEQVVKQMEEFFRVNRTDIRWIVYYDEEDRLMVWDIQEKRAVSYEKKKHSPSHTAAFLDDIHTFGTDVRFGEWAEALLTYNSSLPFERLRQASGRMRGLASEGQSFKLVCTNKTKEQLAPVGALSTDRILTQTKTVERDNLGQELLFADLQKIRNSLRRLVLDHAFALADMQESIRVIKEFEDIFISKQHLAPTAFYGKERIRVSSNDLLKAEKTKMIQRLEKSSLVGKKGELEGQLGKIPDHQVEILTEAYRGLEGEGYEILLPNTEIEMIQTMAQERTHNVRQEQNASLLYHVHQHLLNASSLPWQNKEVIPYWPWSEKLNPYDLSSWMKGEKVPSPLAPAQGSTYLSAFVQMGKNKVLGYPSVPLYPLADLLRVSTPLLASLQGVRKEILGSNNFFPMLHPEYRIATSALPFGSFQHPLFEVLLVLSPEKELSVVLLTQKEADYWRGKIQEKRGKWPTSIALYDIALAFIVSFNPDCPFPEEVLKGKLFQEILVQLKFFKGDPEYRKESLPALKGWIETNGVSPVRSAFFALTKNPQAFFGSELERLCKQREVPSALLV